MLREVEAAFLLPAGTGPLRDAQTARGVTQFPPECIALPCLIVPGGLHFLCVSASGARARGGHVHIYIYIYTYTYVLYGPPCDKHSGAAARSAAVSVLGFESGRIFVWTCRVEGISTLKRKGSSVY